jgi:predicted phosphodiesterase
VARPFGDRLLGHPAANPGGLWMFGVDTTSAQLTWRALGPGKLTVEVREVSGDTLVTRVATDGGPGSVILHDLRPGRRHDLVATGEGLPPGGARGRFTTLAPPPGAELFRFATVSDLHLGERRFGYFGTMAEDPVPDVHHPERALAAALDEIGEWGAQLLVVKGDVTNDGRVEEWETFGRLVGDGGLRWEATVGNHDNRTVDRTRDLKDTVWWLARGGLLKLLINRGEERGPAIEPFAGLAHIGHVRPHPVQSIRLPGLHLALADTTRVSRHLGWFAPLADELVAEAADAHRDGLPFFMAAHHYPMRHRVPHFWPPGVPADDARAFYTRLHDANPRSFSTAGHTHRNRRYDRSGVTCTEVGSPKDFPGTWAAYTVHEGGITQVVRRVGRPDVLSWTDFSGGAAFGIWSAWSPGRLRWRCFTHTWP